MKKVIRMGERLIYRKRPSKFTKMGLSSCLCLTHAEFAHESVLQDIREVDVALHRKRVQPSGDGEVFSYGFGIMQPAIGERIRADERCKSALITVQ